MLISTGAVAGLLASCSLTLVDRLPEFRHILLVLVQSMLISTTHSHGLKLGCRPVVAAVTCDYSFLSVIMALV